MNCESGNTEIKQQDSCSAQGRALDLSWKREELSSGWMEQLSVHSQVPFFISFEGLTIMTFDFGRMSTVLTCYRRRSLHLHKTA